MVCSDWKVRQASVALEQVEQLENRGEQVFDRGLAAGRPQCERHSMSARAAHPIEHLYRKKVSLAGDGFCDFFPAQRRE